jgi:hypothetical protein
MAREVSATALQAMLSQQTEQIVLTCLKITHPELPAPLRFVNDRADLTRADGVYQAAAFEFRLPDDTEDNVPAGEVVLDNVDRQIIEVVRPLQQAPQIEVNFVLADTPDVVEVGPIEFKLRQFSYDAQVIRGRLGYEEDFLTQSWPRYRFTPRYSPGVFG